MDTKAKIEVMQAFLDGEEIDVWDGHSWQEISSGATPIWNWQNAVYRVRPKPKEFWIVVHGKTIKWTHRTREEAEQMQKSTTNPLDIIHVREVVDGK